MEPTILYEDDSLVVINKPAGITVNKSDTTIHETTIQDWSEEYLGIKRVSRVAKVPQVPREKNGEARDIRDTLDTSFYDRGGIVHRIDKETSGILLIAKTQEAFEALQRQFKERTVKKTYLTLVHGKVAPKEGEINIPVGRLPWNRRQFGVVAGGREALTRYKTIDNVQLTFNKKKEILSLLEVSPETGRTHQIRVHMKYLNHPIFADFLYAGRKTSRDDRMLLGRVFLHAHSISFIHPVTSERIAFQSQLPSELQSVIDKTEKIDTSGKNVA